MVLFKKLFSYFFIMVELGVDVIQCVWFNKNDFLVIVDGQFFSGDIIFMG